MFINLQYMSKRAPGIIYRSPLFSASQSHAVLANIKNSRPCRIDNANSHNIVGNAEKAGP